VTFSRSLPIVVVDASVALGFLAGELTWVDHLRRWAEADAMLLAPPHFPAEVANALLRGARTSAVEAASRLERLFASGVETADRGLPGLLGAVELAERHTLTVYDALYLDLALDVDAELATLDRDLARAAAAEGLTVAGG
jgi:predicted nucleic acid-binding protein